MASAKDGRTLRREKSRLRMLDSAKALCEESGDTGFTLAEVAQAAGVTRQTVYEHFGSKGGLLLALVEHIDSGNDLGDRIRATFELPAAADTIRSYFDMCADLTPLILPVAEALQRNRAVDPDAAAAWDDRMSGRHHSCIMLAERLASQHEFRPGWDVASAADLIYAAISVQSWQLLVGERGWTPEQWAQRSAEAVLRTLIE